MPTNARLSNKQIVLVPEIIIKQEQGLELNKQELQILERFHRRQEYFSSLNITETDNIFDNNITMK